MEEGRQHEPTEAHEALDMIREVGGQDLVRMLLRTFIEYSDAQIARARAAATAGDAPDIARVAHAMKSSARQVGAHALADVCAKAEAAGAGSRDVATAVTAVDGMESEYAAARTWMSAVAG